jgi:putative iron-regulated protein
MRVRGMLAAGIVVLGSAASAAAETDPAAVVDTYADIAEATYGDALIAARALSKAVDALIAEPSAATMTAARAAWRAARVPYQQSEAFRFGNPIVDEWEGKVNAWPLDEGLIDYVDAGSGAPTDENPYAGLNVIANPQFVLSGNDVDAAEITPALLSDVLQEADAIETNVATGYHAIEFLLWGQDLHGIEAGAGERPWSDYAHGGDCTHGNCDRRAAYLAAATELLVTDLEYMAAQWDADGAARANVLADPKAGVIAILTGMGSLSYGEQAGERMRLGLMLNDPEEEHDCFSDNTYNSHYYDGMGVRNVYEGRYVRIDGAVVAGPSVADLVAEADPQVDVAMRDRLDATMQALGEIKTVGEGGMAYDQMLGRGNVAGEALVMGGVEALIAQTRAIERAVAALGLDQLAFEGSDSLDAPEAVFQ